MKVFIGVYYTGKKCLSYGVNLYIQSEWGNIRTRKTRNTDTFHAVLISFLECGCDPAKTLDSICEAGTGICECKVNYAGPKCERCAPGHYAHPNCYGML